jgi:hypothetical protein
MDKDDYLNTLEEASCFNFENYISDIKWRSQCSLSHISKGCSPSISVDKENEIKKNKIEANAIKYYEYLWVIIPSSVLEDTYFYEKIKKENNDRKLDSSHKFATNVHCNLDDEYERKIKFFEKLTDSNTRYRQNKLGKVLCLTI